MRCSIAVILAVALTTACTAPADETADDMTRQDTAATTGADMPETGAVGSSAGDARSRGEPPATTDGADTPGARDGADAPDAPADTPPDDSGDVAAVIPSRFHGEWNADLSACGTGASPTRLRISADQLRFYESVGAVREVDIASDRVVTVTAEFQGEGDTWQDERTLTLSADGSSLTVSGGGDLVRHRCP